MQTRRCLRSTHARFPHSAQLATSFTGSRSDRHCPVAASQKQSPTLSKPHSLLLVQRTQRFPALQRPLRQSSSRKQPSLISHDGQRGPPQSMSVSCPFLIPSVHVAPDGGGGGGGGDRGGDAGGDTGGDPAHAPRVAPCLSNLPFLLFLASSVCPARQSVTFLPFLAWTADSFVPARPNVPKRSAPASVRRRAWVDQARVSRSKRSLSKNSSSDGHSILRRA